MNATRFLGLVILVVGVLLQPIGWGYVHWLTPASFNLILTGVVLLLLDMREVHRKAARGRPLEGDRALPGDIHGHSGQLSGGRSASWESHHSAGGAEAAD